MTTLYDIIGVATDVMEMSIGQLTAQPKVCEQLVTRVQNIGKAWDEHPDWHGRNWYVQVLLAIASLSRVVEWWEAEKQFWNFDDNDDEQEEPLLFVMKPPDEAAAAVPSTPSMKQGITESGSALKVGSEEEARLRMSRTTSAGRRSRGEPMQPLSFLPVQQEPKEPEAQKSVVKDNAESARVLATERLRLQAETAQNQNIVLELTLDGDHLLWVNYAWRFVVGYVHIIGMIAITTRILIFSIFAHTVVSLTSLLVVVSPSSLHRLIGMFSAMPLGASWTMTLTPSKSASRSGFTTKRTVIPLVAMSSTSRWRARVC